MMNSQKEVSIIIVSYNNAEVLEKTIYNLIKYIPFAEIIVVDNNSTDKNVSIIRNKFPEVKLIQNKINYGFARGCNIGALEANNKYLLFINSDVIVSKNPIPQMISVFKEYSNVGIVGAQLYNSDNTFQPSNYSYPTLLKRILQLVGLKSLFKYFVKTHQRIYNIKEVEIVKGAFMMISKDIFFRFGGFDENYFMYVEDIDLSAKLLKEGYKNFIVNTGGIIHLGWNESKLSNETAFYYGNIGLIYFYKKFSPIYKYICFLSLNIFFFSLWFIVLKLFVKDYKKNILLKKILLKNIEALKKIRN